MAKFALCIGINYPGTSAQLYGCVNDALGWAQELDDRGFIVRQLLDHQATGAAIREHIANLVAAARWGDVVVVTYSGHGTWTVDRDGDEADRRDEALCPVDFRNGVITDDELHDLFAERRHGARLVLVSDSCHSGTVNRLAAPVGGCGPVARYLPPEHHLPKEALPAARAVADLPARGRSRPTALLMAGCADTEYAYDGYGDRAMGAFSAVALDILRSERVATYREWWRAIRRRLPAQDLPQSPQLVGSRTQVEWPIFEGIDR